jgi:hypothetical protein
VTNRPLWPAALGADTPTDRARTIAKACWNALYSPDPVAAAEAIREMCAALREDWLTATVDTLDPDAYWTRAQVAQVAGVDPDTVTTWTTRGFAGVRLIRHPHGYDPDEVRNFLRHRDRTRTRTLPREDTDMTTTIPAPRVSADDPTDRIPAS